MIKKLFLPALLWAVSLLPAFAQADQPKDEKAELTRKQNADKLEQLMGITFLKDEQQKRLQLEKYLEENPNGPHLVTAYMALFWPVLKTDPARALEVANRFLERVPPDDKRMKITAYRFKYEALKALKKEADVAALSRNVLETETEPDLLAQMAYYDKENALHLYEKAVTEKRKSGGDRYSNPTLSDLLSGYARLLVREEGGLAKSIDLMREAIQVDEGTIRELEKADGVNKSQIKPLQVRVSENSLSLAQMYVKSADGKKALEAIDKAEAAGSIALERRSAFLGVRAETYSVMGDREKAFETYLRSFAVRMDPATWRKIQTISRETGRRDQDVMAAVVRLSRTGGQPFSPFELKDLQGETKTFNDFKQKVTLVNFFFPT
ncbi:MAG: hypothetical protein EHM61_17945 [Acidobacteria bacterium]|nr:MAG: hypothetical protein EHM61_17945 [Acidobacteriota bacterium]